MPSYEKEPEFFKVQLKKAPKPRDYDCPHHSGEGDTLLKKLQEGQDGAAPKQEVRAEEPAAVVIEEVTVEEVAVEAEQVAEPVEEQQTEEQAEVQVDEPVESAEQETAEQTNEAIEQIEEEAPKVDEQEDK